MGTGGAGRARHRWVKLREHVYICQRCGTGKVNALDGGQWFVTWHRPDGTSQERTKTPPCEVGPRTAAYLAKYDLAP